jgi:hypothetical protein
MEVDVGKKKKRTAGSRARIEVDANEILLLIGSPS